MADAEFDSRDGGAGMRHHFFITGTDTGVGKTVLSALLCAALDAVYWKPIQTGTLEGSDRMTVMRLAGIGSDRTLDEAYKFVPPVAPDWAARWAGVEIDLNSRPPRSQIGRHRRYKFVRFVQRPIRTDSRQPHHRHSVRTLKRARLNRLPIHRIQRRAQKRRQHRLSHAGVRARNKKVMPHPRSTVAGVKFRVRHSYREPESRSSSLRSIAAVNENRSRAFPAGTVGGRIARTANPSACKNSAALSASSFEPTITGTICDSVAAQSHPRSRNDVTNLLDSSRNAARSASILRAKPSAARICPAM